MILSTEFSLRNSLYSGPLFKKLLIQTDLLLTFIEVAGKVDEIFLILQCAFMSDVYKLTGGDAAGPEALTGSR